MAKLRSLGSILGALKPRLGFATGDAKGADRHRNQMAPWRRWYASERWRRLRLEVFTRDGYRCQRTGELCVGKYPAPNSPVANHKRPHKGDAALFWDAANIETVAKHVHDGLIQSEERAEEVRR